MQREEEGASDRHNAKCFLTHRAIDGEITISDWFKHVHPNVPTYPNTPLGARWRVSQKTAEMYLHILHGATCDALKAAAAVEDAIAEKAAELWPPCVLNWTRVKVLLAYMEHLKGEDIRY